MPAPRGDRALVGVVEEMRKLKKPPNLAAKAVRSALCRPRVMRSKKLYSRKGKPDARTSTAAS